MAPLQNHGVRSGNIIGICQNGSQQSYAPKFVKLDFPRFNGEEDTTSWVCRVEQFFQFHQTPEEEWVALASFHLEGDAQLWYQLLKQDRGVMTWQEFCDDLHTRYGPSQFQDFFGELIKLQQVGSVRDYQARFEKLLSKAGHFPQNYQRRTTSTPDLKKNFLPNKETTTSNTTLPVRRMSTTELQEQRAKGLCYNCNEKFVPGHQCKKLFLIKACFEEVNGDVIIDEEETDHADFKELPKISSACASETMMVRGGIGHVSTTVLVDSGSTHNFMSEVLTKKVGLQLEHGGRFEVVVASGEKLSSPSKEVVLQGVSIPNDKIIGELKFSREARKTFYNQALQGKNLLLSTYEKEILALVLAVQKWRPYLLGQQFLVRTDQRSLKYLWDQKITTTAQQKWLYKLMGFDFVIEYKKGKENIVADSLSRRENTGEESGKLATISQPIPNWVEAIKEEVKSNSDLQGLIKRIKGGKAVGPWEFKGGVIFFKEIIYLAKNSPLIKDIIGMAKVEAVERQLMDRDQIIKELQTTLKEAQSRMKKVYDHNHREREFEEGDWVYLKLQPYRQASISMRKNLKLSPKYYGSFKILKKIGAVAYKLDLPKESRIHLVFHVSLLKKKIGEKIPIQGELPIIRSDDETLFLGHKQF
ncbi:hypothetical protein F0562_017391 [Nyssa sinensis]|uniref:Reverse transcriptase RNase H-like domain-containing protein n=1 Tax=Nyssa sinensis TaxID=561372 RepID=A0A5J4ZHT0_9ASTE|nr:hypothetical protein F0562_017391 [Nyssa sinensis]